MIKIHTAMDFNTLRTFKLNHDQHDPACTGEAPIDFCSDADGTGWMCTDCGARAVELESRSMAKRLRVSCETIIGTIGGF